MIKDNILSMTASEKFEDRQMIGLGDNRHFSNDQYRHIFIGLSD